MRLFLTVLFQSLYNQIHNDSRTTFIIGTYILNSETGLWSQPKHTCTKMITCFILITFYLCTLWKVLSQLGFPGSLVSLLECPRYNAEWDSCDVSMLLRLVSFAESLQSWNRGKSPQKLHPCQSPPLSPLQ